MSPGLIVTLIVVGILAMVGAAIITQSVENARKERRRQVSIINERICHLSAITGDVPNNYMTADLRQFVVGLLRQNCAAILALDANHGGAKSQLQQLDALSSQAFANELDSLKAPFNDSVTGQNIRARIKDLVNIIVAMNKDGALEKSTAVKYVNQGKMMFELISVDIALISARQAETVNKTLKTALINYSSCLKKLKNINTHSQFTQRIGHLQAKVQQLKEKIKRHTEQTTAQAAAESAKQNAHSELDQDADWKIKQEYE